MNNSWFAHCSESRASTLTILHALGTVPLSMDLFSIILIGLLRVSILFLIIMHIYYHARYLSSALVILLELKFQMDPLGRDIWIFLCTFIWQICIKWFVRLWYY